MQMQTDMGQMEQVLSVHDWQPSNCLKQFVNITGG